MKYEQDESLARRSRKYRDHSNFGSSGDTDYGELKPLQESFNQKRRCQERNEYSEYDDYDYTDVRGRVPQARARATQTRADRPESKSRAALGWIISIVLAIAIALLVRGFVFEIIQVDGESMWPTLYTNERVAVEKVSRYFGMPERGDIIIVTYPNMEGTFVKRAIGLPGDTVEVKESVVYINGEPLQEDYINQEEAYADMEAITVPEDHVFVMGDNRAHSLDSRTYYIGSLPHENIVGHGFAVIWPFDEWRNIS